MLTGEFRILNQLGIHARPAALIVKTASRFASNITIDKDGNRVSGKSIMGLMTLEASCGSRLKVMIEGEDAEQAMDALRQLFESKFDEE
jgi:phosphocarrier protein